MLTNQEITEAVESIIFFEGKDTPNLKITADDEIKPEYKLADLGIVNDYYLRRTLKNIFTFGIKEDDEYDASTVELTRRECDELIAGTETVGQFIDKAIALYPKVYARRKKYSEGEDPWKGFLFEQEQIITSGKDKLTNEDIVYAVIIFLAKYTASSYDTYAIELKDNKLKSKGFNFRYGGRNFLESLITIFLNDDEIKSIDTQIIESIIEDKKTAIDPNLYLLTSEELDELQDAHEKLVSPKETFTVGDFIKKVQDIYPKVAARAKS